MCARTLRHALIGDPGQIDPFVSCEIERWRCDPSGPQVSCPAALVKRHPGVLQLVLPVSRRLNEDTVSLIQPAFKNCYCYFRLLPPHCRT